MPIALIVEDEPEANQLLSMLVQLRDYRTESAFTGGEALEKARRLRPDIILLDLMLPDINGHDVCRALKRSRQTNAIPVVMVTARLQAENRLQGFRGGITDYVSKPYTPDHIFAALAHAESWRRRIAEGDREGLIALDARGDVAPLRDIGRLWGLLLARTPIGEDAALRLDQALVEIVSRAVDWGSRNGIGPVAALHHRRDADGVVVTLRDESGWFADDPPRGAEGLGGAIARGRFDEVSHDESAGEVAMTVRFDAGT